MQVILAEKAGFCFGVKRAVDMAFEESENKSGKVYTYGPIIHNEEVTKKLEEAGVSIVESKEELKSLEKGSRLIIRSHGVSQDVFKEAEDLGLNIVDATCPFVSNIHKIVSQRSAEGDVIFVIGNPGHAEVEGTIGWINGEYYVINTVDDINSLPDMTDRNITVVEQTTFSLKKSQEIVAILKDKYYNVNVCKTICNATEERQKEAEELAKSVDAMIVIGGKNSSNTQKLYEISKQQCNNTYYIQTLVDLDLTAFESAFKFDGRVGITAGASTPNYIIKEVQNRMSEQTFEEMLEEQKPVTIRPGQIIDGKVVSVKEDELVVDIHYKSDGILKANEYSNEIVDLTTVVKEGDDIKVKVLKTNDGEGTVLLSHKKVALEKAYDTLQEAYQNHEILKGKVVGANKGLIVNVSECRVFIPGSLVDDSYVKDLSVYIGQEVEFEITEFDISQRQKKIIGDRSKVIRERKKSKAEEFYANNTRGDVIVGKVKNITPFGVFIDLGGIDGLLHISEMSWGRIESPKNVYKVGDEVRCFIKEIDQENNKIALSCKFPDQDPWLKVVEKYPKGSVIEGQIARLADFGAFVVLEPGVDALLHVSQISKDRIGKPSDVLSVGQTVKAVVDEIKVEEKKISLSMKKLEEDSDSDSESDSDAADEVEAVEEAAEEVTEEVAEEVSEEVSEQVSEQATEAVEETPAE
ncbi:MAG: bifunctional 4-hydroxy-3-methylbut-2-enyl diphosphate reductase/30S ribosomal protein S1 [Eubacterium sp.]|nr:bifunctional 4-hydroxy-3-methylbut-2-enyl diphosphate reductase/30S ribosomal protein S1 [Eubacterium sp.]